MRLAVSAQQWKFRLWRWAYVELIFIDTVWPDFNRRHPWHACELYAQPGPAAAIDLPAWSASVGVVGPFLPDGRLIIR